MAYIDKTFFATYSALAIPDAELARLIDRADDLIDGLTMDKIGGDAGFITLTDDTKTRIKKAVAAQVELLYNQGGLDALTDIGAASVSLGKYSESRSGAPAGAMSFGGVPIAPLVFSYLRPTGALFKGLNHQLPRIPLANRITLDGDYEY